MDHATSIVVGETAVVEDDVSMLHEVTLGGTGKEKGDRHPKIRAGVLIGAGAKILGNIEVGEGAKIGAGSVVLNDVPPHCSVAGVPAKIVSYLRAGVPAHEMDHRLTSEEGTANKKLDEIEGLMSPPSGALTFPEACSECVNSASNAAAGSRAPVAGRAKKVRLREKVLWPRSPPMYWS
jgi:hypothetical protein